MSRVYNFSAGPAVLPEEVLREAADEIEGMSAGKIYSPKGERAVLHLDALTAAEASLSAAISALSERARAEERAG